MAPEPDVLAPELAVLATVWTGLVLYALFAGADFGAGVWDMLLSRRAAPAERRLLADAIGPVWEANHVWLIFVLVLLWTAFPGPFATALQALWIPLLAALVGIVCRGAAFAFRAYASGAVRQEALWGAVFSIASTLAPLALGAAAGAVARDPAALAPDGVFRGDPLTGWISWTSATTALLAWGACAYLAAVYMVREARLAGDPALLLRWTQRAQRTGVAMGPLAALGLVVVAHDAPALWDGFRERGLPFVALSACGGMLSILLVTLRRPLAADVAAAVAVATIVAGWGAAQFAPGSAAWEVLRAAAAPRAVLEATLAAVAAGAVVLVPSLVLLFRVFKSRAPARPGP